MSIKLDKVKDITKRLKEITTEQGELLSDISNDVPTNSVDILLETLDDIAIADLMRRGMRESLLLKIKEYDNELYKGILQENANNKELKNKLKASKARYSVNYKKEDE